jgi:hypothetical protein
MADKYCSMCGEKLVGAFCGSCGTKKSDSSQPVSLKENKTEMDDAQLIEIVYRNPQDYTTETKELANAEIDKREIRAEQIQKVINEHHLAKQNKFPYRDISSLTNTLILLLKATVLISLIAVISDIFEIILLNDMKTGNFDYLTIEDQTIVNDTRQQLIGIIQISLLIITGIVFLRWIYFSNSNSQSLGATGMQFTPGWSIGWYFVPIMTFFKPYQAMKEIWQTSKNTENWSLVKAPSLLPQWWTLWLISLFLGNISFRLSLRAEEIDEYISYSSITLVSDLVDIPLALIAIKLVGSIFDMQNEKHITPSPPDDNPHPKG